MRLGKRLRHEGGGEGGGEGEGEGGGENTKKNTSNTHPFTFFVDIHLFYCLIIIDK